jgi:hypothetical protein
MQKISRRGLIKIGGLSTAALATIGVPTAGRRLFSQPEALRFQAILGLPEPPLPSYATYVVDGALDLASKTGVVVSRVLAGHPGARSDVGLPGLGRIVTVTGIERQGSLLTIRGVIEDRSQLQPGENHQVELIVDRDRGVVRAPFGNRSVVLNIV